MSDWTPHPTGAPPSGAVTRGWLTQRAAVVLSVLAVLFVVSTLGVAMATGVGRVPSGETAAKFEVAPDFTLPTFDGGSVTLSENDGGPVLLFFWASWCVPCQEEAPLIARAWPEYERRGYTFIGVNMTDTETDARAFITKYGLSDVPMVRDEQGRVYLNYGVEIVSESFFLRPGRRVGAHFVNGWSETILRNQLDALAAPVAAFVPARKRTP